MIFIAFGGGIYFALYFQKTSLIYSNLKKIIWNVFHQLTFSQKQGLVFSIRKMSTKNNTKLVFASTVVAISLVKV